MRWTSWHIRENLSHRADLPNLRCLSLTPPGYQGTHILPKLFFLDDPYQACSMSPPCAASLRLSSVQHVAAKRALDSFDTSR
jgi:hypothetical protein